MTLMAEWAVTTVLGVMSPESDRAEPPIAGGDLSDR
jgi:hypothetical protein